MSRVKAYGYINSSGTENGANEKQELTIRRYATAQNIKIMRFYREDLTNRNSPVESAFSKLLLDLEGNDQGINILLVENLDHLAQDLTVQSALIWELRSQGCEVISALEGSLYNS